MDVDETFLASEARRHDPDRYLCALFAPAASRPSVFALILFNHELARIPEVASETITGMIRYQWWRDAVDEAARGEPRDHPVVLALAEGMSAGRLEAASLMALIDAREAEIESLRPADLDALEAYVTATAGKLNHMTAKAIGASDSADAAQIAGVAYGLIGILRAAEAYARQGRMELPRDLVAQPILERAGKRLAEMRRLGFNNTKAAAALLLASVARRQISAWPNSKGAQRHPLLPLELYWRTLSRRY